MVLAGTLYLPRGSRAPRAAVLMIPGSGPSDRDNDVYFPPIRRGLLAGDIAVASFDKRGVGGSAGDWHDTDIEQQATDAHAALAVLRARPELHGTPIGLFGHSQGGWVVLEVAASDPAIAFAVTNSGPGVSPARQMRYATESELRDADAAPEDLAAGLDRYDAMVALVRAGANADAVNAAAPSSYPHIDQPLLELHRRMLDHDPIAALRRISCPVLALFGADDRSVDARESEVIYRTERRAAPGGVDVVVFPGASHRMLRGEPPALHPDYLPTLTSWIQAAAAPARSPEAALQP